MNHVRLHSETCLNVMKVIAFEIEDLKDEMTSHIFMFVCICIECELR